MIAVSLRRLRAALLPLLLLPLALTAQAHEGHEHEEAVPAAAVTAIPAADAPRLTLTAPQFELVAVRDTAALLIYVDDYDSNAPLADLQLQVQSGSRSTQAEALEPGLYRVALAALGLDNKPGTAPLSFIVRSPQWQARVDGVLPAAASAKADHFLGEDRRLLFVLVLLAIVVIVVRVLRRLRSARS